MTKLRTLTGILLLLALVAFPGCAGGMAETEDGGKEMTQTSLKLYIGDTLVPVEWEANTTLSELQEQAREKDIVVQMDMYGGFEQVGSLGRRYTRNDRQTTTQCGDIVLYNGSSIVVFYGSNTWSYTRLGKMKLQESDVAELLCHGNVTLRLAYSAE